MAKGSTVDVAAAAQAAAGRSADLIESAEPANRYDGLGNGGGLFTAVSFERAKSDKTYNNDDGSKQRTLAAAVLTMGRYGHLNTSINAIQRNGDAKPKVEIKFVGSRTQRSFVVADPTAAAELEQFKAEVLARFKTWWTANGTAPTTKTAPTAIEMDISL